MGVPAYTEEMVPSPRRTGYSSDSDGDSDNNDMIKIEWRIAVMYVCCLIYTVMSISQTMYYPAFRIKPAKIIDETVGTKRRDAAAVRRLRERSEQLFIGCTHTIRSTRGGLSRLRECAGRWYSGFMGWG